MQRRLAVGGFVAALLLCVEVPLAAQLDLRDRRLPLAPNRPAGEAVAPFQEVWYRNPDGTYTLSFGYFNFNTKQTLEIPIGPDNFIEPAEFNGVQPTYFPGPNKVYDRRERGVFTVTVPADYGDGQKAVVWTLTSNGETHRVAARVGAQALSADYGPMALGSVPPLLSFEENGAARQHPSGLTLERTLTARVGTPLALPVWVRDPSVRSKEALGPLYEETPIGITWFKHQGPVGGEVTFQRTGEPWREPGEGGGAAEESKDELEAFQDRLAPEGGKSTMTATFSRPGDYVLRVRADNFEAEDSDPADQCCWTNGYVRVRVTQ